jgi:predicted transcriptional regulator
MTTTIQLSNELKGTLSDLKVSSKQTYEDIIIKLVENYREIKSNQEEKLKQGYLELNKLNSEINEDFDKLYGELD